MEPPPPFDAERWLSQFRAAGGFCWFPQIDDMHVGWQIDERRRAAHLKAKRLYDSVEYCDDSEERWSAIEAVVRRKYAPRTHVMH